MFNYYYNALFLSYPKCSKSYQICVFLKNVTYIYIRYHCLEKCIYYKNHINNNEYVIYTNENYFFLYLYLHN